MCELVDREARKQAKKYICMSNSNHKNRPRDQKIMISDLDKKMFMDNKMELEKAFGKSAIQAQELNIMKLRT